MPEPTRFRVTKGDLLAALAAFRWFTGRTLKHPLSFEVSQTLSLLERRGKTIGEEQEALMRTYADRDGDKPKRDGDQYVIVDRLDDYRDAMARLDAEVVELSARRFSLADFDFLLPAPEGKETDKSIERTKFLDTVVPGVWSKMGPFLTDNEVEELPAPVLVELAAPRLEP